MKWEGNCQSDNVENRREGGASQGGGRPMIGRSGIGGGKQCNTFDGRL